MTDTDIITRQGTFHQCCDPNEPLKRNNHFDKLVPGTGLVTRPIQFRNQKQQTTYIAQGMTSLDQDAQNRNRRCSHIVCPVIPHLFFPATQHNFPLRRNQSYMPI